MKTTFVAHIQDRLKNRQMFIFFAALLFCGSIMVEAKIVARPTSYLRTRSPSSAPDEEPLIVPTFDRPLLMTIFAEDDAGVMASMRNDLKKWEEEENYAKTWNLESSGLYKIHTSSDKKAMVANRLLKYADKRLAGEIKNADEGSTLHTVGKVEKSMRPNAEVAFAKNISIKFRARVLQGKAMMEIKNPWVQSVTTLSANGEIKMLTQKEFEKMGLTPGVEYAANDSSWVAFLDQKLTENIKARVSSTQKNQSITHPESEKKIEMTATFPFNF